MERITPIPTGRVAPRGVKSTIEINRLVPTENVANESFRIGKVLAVLYSRRGEPAAL